MTEARFDNKGHKYIFDWPDYALHAETSRISVNHQSSRCLLVFTSTHPDANSHILQTRFNLESARTRSELAKEMASRYKIETEIDWKNLIEYVSVKTIREYEKGEPLVKISSQDKSFPLEYLIKPIAPLHKPTVIFGDPGAGKSQMALILNILIAMPWIDNPLRLTAPSRPIKTLYLDYEADEEDIRRQLISLSSGMELRHVEFHYRRCSLPFADDLPAIREHIDDIDAECLLIDSMSLAAGGDLNHMDIATAYFRALRQLSEITSISLAHTSKDRENKSKTIIGSMLWEAGARSVWEIKGEEDEDTLNLALFHRKANLSKKSGALGYQITYQNDMPSLVQWYDPKSIPEFVERMGAATQILQLLKEGPMENEKIDKTLTMNASTRRSALSRLKKKNLVIEVEGKWGLLGHDE